MKLVLRDKGDTRVVAEVKDKYKSVGEKVLDIRAYFKPDGKNEWIPTKKGVSLGAEEARMVLDKKDDILKELESQA